MSLQECGNLLVSLYIGTLSAKGKELHSKLGLHSVKCKNEHTTEAHAHYLYSSVHFITVKFFRVFSFSVASCALSTTPSPTTLSGTKFNYTTPENVTRVTTASSREKTMIIQSTAGNK